MIPLSYLVTPNIPEAEILTGRKINNLSDTKEVAKIIHELGAANVLIKGGHVMDKEKHEDYVKKMRLRMFYMMENPFIFFKEIS